MFPQTRIQPSNRRSEKRTLSVPSLMAGRTLPAPQTEKISAFSCQRSSRFTIPTSIHTDGSGLSFFLLLSVHPSIPRSHLPSLHPQPACFLSLSGKVDPLHSSEIKTGRCKLQINVIKCLHYHRPSHWSGWLLGV